MSAAEQKTGIRPDAADQFWLQRVFHQDAMFLGRKSRNAMAQLASILPSVRSVRIAVVRNRPFESIADAASGALAFAGFECAFEYTEYDDALSDTAIVENADATLIWLSFSHYKGMRQQDFSDWLQDRLNTVRARFRGVIILADDVAGAESSFSKAVETVSTAIPGVIVWKVSAIATKLGPAFFDKRMESISGDTLSNLAVMELGAEFGLQCVSAAVESQVKAVIVDLDLTLYDGVLGEEGADGVILTDGHLALQQALVDLSQRGILIAVLSKNEIADAMSMFSSRSDFLLRAEHVAAWSVSWDPKPVGMRSLLDKLRIGQDVVVYIDDNLGELTAMAQAFPKMRLIHACTDAHLTARALTAFPGLLPRPVNHEDMLRARDLIAAEERVVIESKALDKTSYLKALEVQIRMAADPAEHRVRLADLCRKTNQFNLALRRLSEADVESRLLATDGIVFAGWLSDRLSDAGLIAAIYTRLTSEGALHIDELCLSCRSLGRGIEDLIIVHAIDRACQRFETSDVRIDWVRGPRNQPALSWLQNFFEVTLPDQALGTLKLRWRAEYCRKISELPVQVQWSE